MKLVIEYDMGSDGGTPDPMMARLVVDAIRSALNTSPVIARAVAEVAERTNSNIPLDERYIAIERTSPAVYGARESVPDPDPWQERAAAAEILGIAEASPLWQSLVDVEDES